MPRLYEARAAARHTSCPAPDRSGPRSMRSCQQCLEYIVYIGSNCRTIDSRHEHELVVQRRVSFSLRLRFGVADDQSRKRQAGRWKTWKFHFEILKTDQVRNSSLVRMHRYTYRSRPRTAKRVTPLISRQRLKPNLRSFSSFSI